MILIFCGFCGYAITYNQKIFLQFLMFKFTMKKFCYMQLVNSRNFLHLRTYNRDNNFILFKNILGRSITSRLLTTPITKNDNDLNDLPDNQDEEEILKTHQIPGRYLHY